MVRGHANVFGGTDRTFRLLYSIVAVMFPACQSSPFSFLTAAIWAIDRRSV